MDLELPVADIEIVFEMLRNVFKVLVAHCGSLLCCRCFEDAIFAGGKTTREDHLRAKIGTCGAVREGFHAVSLLGVGAVGSFGREGQVAALGVADPNDIGAVEVVQMLLKITLATKSDRAAVQITHRALVLLSSRGNQAWRGMRSGFSWNSG